jgi:hypothetical protein
MELAQMQVGDDKDSPADFVVSTLMEAEHLVPFLKECEARGRKGSVSRSSL